MCCGIVNINETALEQGPHLLSSIVGEQAIELPSEMAFNEVKTFWGGSTGSGAYAHIAPLFDENIDALVEQTNIAQFWFYLFKVR